MARIARTKKLVLHIVRENNQDYLVEMVVIFYIILILQLDTQLAPSAPSSPGTVLSQIEVQHTKD